MNEAPYPSNLTGRVGMVAMVERVRAHSPGRLVVLQEPAGLLTALVRSPTPVFCWWCHVLGDPVLIDGKACRDVYIPDPCLTPISQMTRDQIHQVARDHAGQDFDGALADLGRILGGTNISGAELELSVDRAARRSGIERCLESVATVQALREAGFRPIRHGSDTLRWVVVHRGMDLLFEAGPDFCGHWVVTSRGRSSREIFGDETRLPPEGARGLLLQQVLNLWRGAFGKAPVPDGLSPAITYEQHQVAIRRAARPPQLSVDPQVFRAVRRWLMERFRHCDRTAPVKLGHAEALLRIEVEGVAFGCPAEGVWADKCSVDLGDLLDIDAFVLRRRSLKIELMPNQLLVNGWPLRACLY